MSYHWIDTLPLVGNELCLRWVITLLHFFWQGVAIGVVAVAARWILRERAPLCRYRLHAVLLLCLPVCVVVTFATVDVPGNLKQHQPESERGLLVMNNHPVAASETSQSDAIPGNPSIHNDRDDLSAGWSASRNTDRAVVPEDDASAAPLLARAVPLVAVFYFAGACFFLLRLGLGVCGGHRLRASSKPVDDSQLLELIVNQSRKVGLKLVPLVRYCERVAVPTVIGVLRPVILLPASLLTGLNPAQIAAIICHELAHIRRHDLLMNLLQRIIESLLFFHPVVWYVSRRVSAEREACCDDLVISTGYEPMQYAGALLRMAELCTATRTSRAAALAASGDSESEFEHRIVRLMNAREQPRLRLSRGGVVMTFLLLASVVITPAVLRSWVQAQESQPIKEQSESQRAELSSDAARLHGLTGAGVAVFVADAGAGGPPTAATSQDDDQWPPRDPVKFLKRLHLRDHELHSRSLQIERRWVAQIDPRAKVGPSTDAEIPSAYDQPHRVPYLVTTSGSQVWAIDNGHDLETMKHSASEKAIQAARWPIGPRMMAWNSVMMDGYFRETQQKHSLAQPFEWALGYGFARTLVSIDSMNAWKNDDRLIIKGKSRVFLYGRPRVRTKNTPAGTDSVPEPDSHFEIELDRDLIVRRAVISLDLRSRGYEKMAPDAYRIKRFVVQTSGTSRLIDAPPIAARGRFQRIAKDPEKSKGIQRDETIAFVGISGKLTQEKLRQRLHRDREPYTGNTPAKKRNRPKEPNVEIKKTGKSVVVDKSKFSDLYPAVWFSPSTGEIAPLKVRSEKPPEEKYEIWIEPKDPEFRYLIDQKPGAVGFSLLGKGDRVFQKAIIPDKPELKPNILDLMKEADTAEKPVFYCKSKKRVLHRF
jgi:beta-lactamase regulating signal transducer with metallopeptidase domain